MKLLILHLALQFALQLIVAGKEPIRVACVGDSITYGSGIKDRTTRSYPAQLQQLLGTDYQVKNFGVSGATMLKKGNMPYWKQNAFQKAQDFRPDIVVIKLGTNDSKPENWKHKTDYTRDYLDMIQTFEKLPGDPKIWICYPAPVFAYYGGINNPTVKGEIIPMIDDVSKQSGAKIIDLYEALKGKEQLVPDKVHPNAEGAGLIAASVAKAIKG